MKQIVLKKPDEVVVKALSKSWEQSCGFFTGILIIVIFILMVAAQKQPGFSIFNFGRLSVSNILPQQSPKISSALLSPQKNEHTIRLPILLYHYVEIVRDSRDTIRKSLDILPNTFRTQVKTLLDAGYTFVTVGEAIALIDEGRSLPEKVIILTFDDGYRDFFTDAFPIIKELHLKVTAYIVPGFLGGKNYMTQEQIKEIAHSGLVEIGAHTQHHVNLRSVPVSTIGREVVGSKKDLEALIGQPVVSFAYPYGAFNDSAIAIVKAAGFTSAVIGANPRTKAQTRWKIGRFRAGSSTGNALRNIISQQTSLIALSPL